MSDYRPADLPLPPDDFDGSRPSPSLSPADAAVFGGLSYPLPPPVEGGPPPAPAAAAATPAVQTPSPDDDSLVDGVVLLDRSTLRRLRRAKLLSQQELVYDFQRRNINVSIATIKRAETGHAVRYRIARELARYFGVFFDDLL
jgi:hypothetical protein